MSDKPIRSLYISYNAITEPITRSQVLPYLKQLSAKGIEFFLLTYEKEMPGKKEADSIRKSFEGEFAVKWFYLRYHKRPSVLAKPFDMMAGIVYSLFLAVKYKVDVIHARAIMAALAGYPAARLCGKKFIFDTRGIDSEEYVDALSWRKGGFKHRVISSLESFLTKHSDQVVVLTEKFLEVMKEKYRNNKAPFTVIPCAVDTERFCNVNPGSGGLAGKLELKNKFVIVYIGSLGTWYMIDEMILLFKAVLRARKDAHILFITQTEHSIIFDSISRNGLDRILATVISVKHEDIPVYLSLCSAGIFFIKPVFSKLSSSPVKFGEYLASGLPVIINRGIGDTEEIVRDDDVGVIIDGFNDADYDKASRLLLELVKDPGAKKRCMESAIKRLSLSSAVEKYYDIYKALARHRIER